jgi:hypothetical protein
MKKTLFSTLLTLSCFISLNAFAKTEIQQLRIDYSRTLTPADNHGYTIFQAIVGGKVDFIGQAPIYVTMQVGGQTYTTLTDPAGFYSFFVYTNNAGQYNLQAWTNDVAPLGKNNRASITGQLK